MKTGGVMILKSHTHRRSNLREHRAIARILILTVMVATSRTAHGASGVPPMERQFKGQLDLIGPFGWLDLDGRRWTEHDFAGKVLIVQQWATWCGACVAGFPEVQKLSDAVRHDSAIAFVSLNMDRDPAAIGEFLLEFPKKYSFRVLFAGAQLKIKSLPHTWIVDREGYIRDGFGAAGPGFVEQVLAAAEAVKHRLPVSTIPPEVRQEKRRQNELDGAGSQ